MKRDVCALVLCGLIGTLGSLACGGGSGGGAGGGSSGGSGGASAGGVDNGGALAIDGSEAYWFGPDEGSIDKVALDGGTAAMLEKNLSNDPVGIAIDSTHIYWNNGDAIVSALLDGGSKSTLASVLQLSDSSQQPSIAVNAAGVYATTDSTIVMVPLAGGTAKPLVSQQSPLAITADANNVYWLNNNGNGVPATVMKIATSGSATAVTLATVTGTAIPEQITVDANNVYWIESLGSVKKVPIAGGTPVVLASAPTEPGGIAVDATSVYWTDTAAGTVWKAPK